MLGCCAEFLATNSARQNNVHAARHHRDCIAQLDGLHDALVDAETGQRGFLLTRDIQYLTPYNSGRVATPVQIQQLRKLFRDDPIQQDAVAKLDALSQAKLAELRTTVDLAGRNHLNEAIKIVKGNSGKHVMDQARDVIGRADKLEHERLSVLIAQFDSESQQLVVVEIVGTVAALLIVLSIATIVYEDIVEHRAKTQELVEAAEAREKFFATIVHDLRTPVTTIKMTSELLQNYSDKLDPQKIKESFDKIFRNLKQLQRLMDDILLVVRGDVGKLQLDPMLMDVSALVQGLVDEAQPTTNRHRIEFKQTGTWHEVNIDPALFQRAITNLLSNAIKYSDGGLIVVLVIYASDKLIIKVSDQGRGIAPSDLPFLFQAFHRVGDSRSIAGIGLGLSIVRACAIAHGGTAEVNSFLGHGSTFTLTIPNTRFP